MTEENKNNLPKPFKGAKVNWPPDMPDHMLESVIAIAKEQMSQHDFEENGVEIAKAIK
jgi:hypothetical protein